ncbi:MAG: bifunctional serine/threonine-protein kinase/formylglycine-generating enzyme family protein [Planctomycetota bacterium]
MPGHRTLGPLARGGMAQVLLVEPHELPGVVRAAKLLLLPGSERQRLIREVQAMARLSHPNVVRVHTAGVTELGHPYFVMDYVAGRSLDELLRERGRLEWPEAARLALDAARGLEAAHAAGIVHRDVKPANVLVDAEGRARVADFGVARVHDASQLTRTGVILGTPAYVSPEQVSDPTRVSGKADVYSLAATLYELVTGAQPLAADSLPRQLFLLADAVPAPASSLVPGLPARLDALLARGLEKDPAARPDAGAFAAELTALLARADGGPSRARALLRAAGLAGLALGAAALASAFVPARAARPGPAAAARPSARATPPRPATRWILERSGARIELARVGATGALLAIDELRWRDWEAYLGAAALPDARLRTRPLLFETGPEHPVTERTWREALDCCRWLGGRLPTAAEYRLAATNGGGTTWPWGESDPAARLNCAWQEQPTSNTLDQRVDGQAYLAPAGSYPTGANRAGHRDLCGNAREWCLEDRGDGHHYTFGGDFSSTLLSCRPDHTVDDWRAPDTRGHMIGFRLVLTIPPGREEEWGLRPLRDDPR